MENKFKAGDRVEVTTPSFMLPAGKYEVKDAKVLDDAPYIRLHSNVGWWYEHRFIRAKPASRTDDPATSKGARKVNKYEEAVIHSVRGRGLGMTGKEIAQETGHPLNCITPRFAPLRRKGLIKDSGIKRDKQIVWVMA